ncbi:MAG: hypothetical protein PHI99_05975, partial [Syntrophales bacterium]|nr:hypothetical protein [Syntrophales bacterium]
GACDGAFCNLPFKEPFLKMKVKVKDFPNRDSRRPNFHEPVSRKGLSAGFQETHRGWIPERNELHSASLCSICRAAKTTKRKVLISTVTYYRRVPK